MPEDIGATAEALSRATSGPDTPNDIKVRRPSTAAVACQVIALIAACIFAAAIIAILAWKPMPPPPGDDHQRLFFLGWMGLACIACIALSGLSQFRGRVEASAGPGHLELGGADERH